MGLPLRFAAGHQPAHFQFPRGVEKYSHRVFPLPQDELRPSSHNDAVSSTRGVPDTHIQSAIEESADEAAERAAIRHRIDRKLKLTLSKSGSGEISDKKIASLYRSLLAAGFPSDAIRRELKSITHEELPIPDDPLDEPSS